MARLIDSQFEFARRYEVEQLARIGRAGASQVLGFPGAVRVDPQQELADGPVLRVHPADGEPWVAVFRGGGYGSPPAARGRLLGWPDERSLCVVYAGSAVVVRADEPTDTFEVESFPITGMLVAPQLRLVVFSDFSSFTAYGPERLLWRAELASDEARIESVEGNLLHGSGFVAGVEGARFTVELTTGELADADPVRKPDRP